MQEDKEMQRTSLEKLDQKYQGLKYYMPLKQKKYNFQLNRYLNRKLLKFFFFKRTIALLRSTLKAFLKIIHNRVYIGNQTLKSVTHLGCRNWMATRDIVWYKYTIAVYRYESKYMYALSTLRKQLTKLHKLVQIPRQKLSIVVNRNYNPISIAIRKLKSKSKVNEERTMNRRRNQYSLTCTLTLCFVSLIEGTTSITVGSKIINKFTRYRRYHYTQLLMTYKIFKICQNA